MTFKYESSDDFLWVEFKADYKLQIDIVKYQVIKAYPVQADFYRQGDYTKSGPNRGAKPIGSGTAYLVKIRTVYDTTARYIPPQSFTIGTIFSDKVSVETPLP